MKKAHVFTLVVLSLVMLLTISAVAGGGVAEAQADKSFILEGTVVHNELEGGFFAIKGQDGKTYVPINLPEEFEIDGLSIRIKANPKNDVGGIHMVGEYIEILKIEKY
nr:hypothetical protein [uncultured Pseudodesulfovibrio sp.]